MKAGFRQALGPAAEARGWQLRRTKGSHHIYEKPGRPEVLSIPVHGNHTLKRGLQVALMKLAGIRPEDI